MGKLVARSHHKMIERIFWIGDGLERMEDLLFIAWQRLGDRVLSIHLFISDSELELTRHMGEERNRIFNSGGIVFVDPLLKESVRDL